MPAPFPEVNPGDRMMTAYLLSAGQKMTRQARREMQGFGADFP
jgi:hypothetical protein